MHVGRTPIPIKPAVKNTRPGTLTTQALIFDIGALSFESMAIFGHRVTNLEATPFFFIMSLLKNSVKF
jgi:hypothetical protein